MGSHEPDDPLLDMPLTLSFNVGLDWMLLHPLYPNK